MADLPVRHVDDALVESLREQAVSRQSATAERHDIPTRAQSEPRPKRFAEVLMDIPTVGDDTDFARVDSGQAADIDRHPDAQPNAL